MVDKIKTCWAVRVILGAIETFADLKSNQLTSAVVIKLDYPLVHIFCKFTSLFTAVLYAFLFTNKPGSSFYGINPQ